MKNFRQFKEDLEAIQERGPVTNTSSNNLHLQKRRESATEMSNKIKDRQLRQQEINKQKRK